MNLRSDETHGKTPRGQYNIHREGLLKKPLSVLLTSNQFLFAFNVSTNDTSYSFESYALVENTMQHIAWLESHVLTSYCGISHFLGIYPLESLWL